MIFRSGRIIILEALQTDAIKQNQKVAVQIIDGFVQGCLLQGKSISEYIQPVILEAIKQKPDLIFQKTSTLPISKMKMSKKYNHI